MKQTEFTIQSIENLTFRIAKLNAIEILALQSQLDFDDMTKLQNLFKFVLEHTEVQVGNQWLPVKEKNKEVYYPESLENDVMAVKELSEIFLSQVIKPVFQNSNESK